MRVQVLVDGQSAAEYAVDADSSDVDLALPPGDVLRLEAQLSAGSCGSASEGYAVWGNGALS